MLATAATDKTIRCFLVDSETEIARLTLKGAHASAIEWHAWDESTLLILVGTFLVSWCVAQLGEQRMPASFAPTPC